MPALHFTSRSGAVALVDVFAVALADVLAIALAPAPAPRLELS